MAASRRPVRISRRQLLKNVAGAAVGLAAGASAYGYGYERHRLSVTHATLPVSGLPDALRGLRIGLLTDTHRSDMVPHEDIESAAQTLMAERPDLIVLGGDYVTWGERGYVQPSADALSGLHAPHGVFAILGNHDDDRDMPAALVAKGFTMLKDARTTLSIRGEPLDLVGIRFWTRKAGDIARLLRGSSGNTILLAHDPRRLTEAAALNVPLVLSGHTHGGQVVLPGVGAVAKVGLFPVMEGMARRENTTLFVSRGVGTVYVPIRLNCPPEVAILTLTPFGRRV